MALRRGQLGQCPPETVSLIATHFSKGTHRGQTVTAQHGSGRSARDTLSKKQALEMTARMKSLMGRRRGPRVTSKVSSSIGVGTNSNVSITRPRGRQTTKDIARKDEESDGAGCIDPLASTLEVRRKGQRKPQIGSKASTGIVTSTKRRRRRETPKCSGDNEATENDKENGDEIQDEDKGCLGIPEEKQEDDEEVEWEG